MKITDLRIRELDGVMEHPDPLWEERVLRPLHGPPRSTRLG